MSKNLTQNFSGGYSRTKKHSRRFIVSVLKKLRRHTKLLETIIARCMIHLRII